MLVMNPPISPTCAGTRYGRRGVPTDIEQNYGVDANNASAALEGTVRCLDRPSLTFRVTLAAAANLGVPVFVHPILPRMCASLLRLAW